MSPRKAGSRDGWTRVRFGDVVRLSTERCTDATAARIDRYVGLEHLEPGDLRIRSWGNVADGVTFTNRFRPGQVLFGKRRAYQRKVAVAEFDGICSGDIYVFEPADDRLHADLLPFICQTDGFFEHALKTSAGSLSPRTNWTSLADYEFYLPPFDEQRRAAALLGKLAANTEAARDLAVRTKRLNDAILLDAIRGAPMAPVGELLEEGPHNGVSPAATDAGRYPTIPIGAVRDGRVNTSENLKWADLDETRYAKFLLNAGDILCVRGNGNRNLCGRVGMVGENASGCFYPDLLIRMRFKSDRLLPDFAVAAWNTTPIHAALIARAKSTNGIYKINGTDIRAHTLPVPPIDVQQHVLKRLNSLGQVVCGLSTRAQDSKAIERLVFAALSP